MTALSNGQKIHAVTVALVVVCMAVAYYGGTVGHARTLTRTESVPTVKPITTRADLYRALGAVQGQTQQGCDGWKLGDVTVLACP